MRAMPVIVGLGGTTRANSSTEKALRASLRAAEAAGAETVLLGAADLALPMYAPEHDARTPEAERLVYELRRCDGVIVASPGYHGTLSGLVKNALDYTEDMREDAAPYLDGRAFGAIGCAFGWAATIHTIAALRSVAHALRAWPTPLGAAINTDAPVFDGDGNVVDEKARFQLETVGLQVVEFARMRQALLQSAPSAS
jgi:FMN reductase